jgi:hypothetical protein
MSLPPKKKGFHRHHIVPKHMGGEDIKENIVYLTPEEHALVHLELYEKYGKYEDAQAFNTLSSQWLDGRSVSGYKQSIDHIQKRRLATDYNKVSEKLKGRISPTKGMTFEYKAKPKISEAQLGKPKSDKTKKKISQTLMGRESCNKIEFYCIYCKKRVPPSRIDRHGRGKKQCVD